jgi:diacylglycerol kinase family enzyme
VRKVAVIAHSGKSFGGGLLELRRELERKGIVDSLWYEISKSKRAPRQVKRALEAGADLIFVWGGDGTLQRCIDAAAGSSATLAIVPAGTANLLAGNLGIPQNIERAVEIGLLGERRALDVGQFDGERFGVMAGAGLDAAMIHQADGTRKIDVKLDRKVLCEIDGGDRAPVKSFKVRVEPRAISICVPKDRSPD